MTGVLDRIVKAYDIRGLVGDELDEPMAELLGAATARVLAGGAGALLVGYDMRPSSPSLAGAFAAGVLAQGVDVVDLGLASTDEVAFASGHLDLPAAMFTASHNPASYNGIKLSRAGAAPVSIDTGLAAIRDLAAAGSPAPAASPGRRSSRSLLPTFARHVVSFVAPAALAGCRVAVDAANGMAGHLWPAVAALLPLETEPLYFELDGTFPNHPANPLDPANLVDLQARVVAGAHMLGLAFDGDADRMFAVDETGRALSASLVGAVIAEHLLAREPGATVLVNEICSRAMSEAVVAAGGRLATTRVGHSFVKAAMARTQALYGVEHSGHHYFRANHGADSGVIAAVLLLEAVASSGQPLSALVAPHDRYVASGERNVAAPDPVAALAAVRARFAAAEELEGADGLRVDVGAGWFSLRPSNTEPYLRLNVEAHDDQVVADLLAAVLEAVAAA